jgi:hypothetical protein
MSQVTLEELKELRKGPLEMLEIKVISGSFLQAFAMFDNQYPYTNNNAKLRIIKSRIENWFLYKLILDKDIDGLDKLKEFYDLSIERYGRQKET